VPPGYRLLESINRVEPAGYAAASPGYPPTHLPAAGWSSAPRSPALLPAAMVNLPLAEVMRLVAVGAPVASSPFAAFRVSGGTPNTR
jgi:hypothetical protein